MCLTHVQKWIIMNLLAGFIDLNTLAFFTKITTVGSSNENMKTDAKSKSHTSSELSK